eukprot:919153_1
MVQRYSDMSQRNSTAEVRKLRRERSATVEEAQLWASCRTSSSSSSHYAAHKKPRPTLPAIRRKTTCRFSGVCDVSASDKCTSKMCANHCPNVLCSFHYSSFFF